MALILVSSTFVPSSADATDAPSVRVRIHDYANVDRAPILEAQRIVSQTYKKIGVRTEWLPVTRPLDPDSVASEAATTDLTLVVLSSDMARRNSVPGSIVGYAAVTRGEAGRVAFIIYDRLRETARRAHTDVVTVMGTVMAHELGHLMLPSESHSHTGLMRGHWAVTDFRRIDLQFSPAQAAEIRQTIGGAGAPFPGEHRRDPDGTNTTVGILATTVN